MSCDEKRSQSQLFKRFTMNSLQEKMSKILAQKSTGRRKKYARSRSGEPSTGSASPRKNEIFPDPSQPLAR
jgi:hypothetical protein